MNQYPPDYDGPKSGISSIEEWASVRDYTAFCYIRDGIWKYSDFDNYLYSMIATHLSNSIQQNKKLKEI